MQGMRKLSFFGSVLREKFSSGSDIDVLVEFEPVRIPGLTRFCGVEMELSEVLGHQLDLHWAASLNSFLRDRVPVHAQVQHDATA